LSSKDQRKALGLFPVALLQNSASFAGFDLCFALDNMDRILIHTEETVKAALHSSYKIDMQMKPFE